MNGLQRKATKALFSNAFGGKVPVTRPVLPLLLPVRFRSLQTDADADPGFGVVAVVLMVTAACCSISRMASSISVIVFPNSSTDAEFSRMWRAITAPTSDIPFAVVSVGSKACPAF